MSPTTTSPQEAPIEYGELFRRLLRHKLVIASCVLGGGVLFLAGGFLMPKVYKSRAVLNIYAKYFQNPLVKDFLSEVSDSSELRAQRESLIRQALSDRFLDEIGERFGIFKASRDSARRTTERDELLKRFESYPISATTYQITFQDSDAERARAVAQAALDEVLATLVRERKKTIETLRDAIRARMETMSLSLGRTADPLASGRPEIVRKEIARLEGEITALANRFTARHPRVEKLQARVDLMRRWLARAGKNGAAAPKAAAPAEGDRALVGGEPDDATIEVYEDLLRKFNYLNISLEMEDARQTSSFSVVEHPSRPQRPSGPRKGILLFWGLVSGALLAAFWVLILEMVQASVLSAASVAVRLHVPLLGRLPTAGWAEPPRSDKSSRANRGASGSTQRSN